MKSKIIKVMLYAISIVLCFACSSGRIRTSYPDDINTYSETVMVPGMSQRDLLLKLALYKVNNRAEYTYSAINGQYTVTFKASKTSNEEREKMYSSASKLRKDVYSVPLHNEAELLEEADSYTEGMQAFGLLYKIAITNPQCNDAVVAYASVIADMERYEEAIYILDFVRDNDIAKEIIPQIEADIAERDAKKRAEAAAEAERIQIERAETARRQAEIQQQPQVQQNETSFADAMRYAADALNAVAQTKQKSNSIKTGNNQASPQAAETSSANCGYYQQRYSQLERNRDNEVNNNNRRMASATGKNKAHDIDAEKANAATSGDYRVINNSKSAIRRYETEMNSIASQARKAGCPGF